jgi:hypothetical protein
LSWAARAVLPFPLTARVHLGITGRMILETAAES